MLVEQAIFTSTQTDRAEGYQLVAVSGGVSAADRKELSVWGPSHDSLAATDAQASSVNFFPLASGNFCISKTTTAAGEYSGRAGPRVCTHCLVAAPSVLQRFANNPFALLRAAVAQGTVRSDGEIPTHLEAIRLVGRCTPVDHGLLTDLSHEPGVEWLTGAVHEMLSCPRWALAAPPGQAARLIAGLLNCLPPECRTEFSFTTGLRWSPRRPFRIVCTTPAPTEIRRLERQQGRVYSVTTPLEVTTQHGWSTYVGEVLRSGRTSTLATALSRPPHDVQTGGLGEWGHRLLQELLTGTALQTGNDRASNTAGQSTVDAGTNSGEHFPRLAEVSRQAVEQHRGARSHAGPSSSAFGASKCRSAESLEILDSLDDAVFDAIDGKPGALEQLRNLWPGVAQHIGQETFDESREHYVRQALAAWQSNRQLTAMVDPQQAATMLDVLAVVLGK